MQVISEDVPHRLPIPALPHRECQFLGKTEPLMGSQGSFKGLGEG